MLLPSPISTPLDPALDRLCELLADDARRLDDRDEWPAEALRLCGEYGVYRWFLPQQLGWSGLERGRSGPRLSAAERRLAGRHVHPHPAERRLFADRRPATTWRSGALAAALGRAASAFATVGISHLTTSRRHLAQPVLTARPDGADFILDGYSPWVTGAPAADVIVLGATLADGRQILAAVDTALPGISTPHAAAAGRPVGQHDRRGPPVECSRRRASASWPARWKT